MNGSIYNYEIEFVTDGNEDLQMYVNHNCKSTLFTPHP